MLKKRILLILLATLALSVSAVKYETTTELSEPSVSGDGELETGDYDYIRAVSSAIQAKWQAPQPNQYPKDIYKQFKKKKLTDLNALAEFTITPEGQVEDLNLKESTALPLFNESCLKAVRDAAPFPEPQRSKIIEYQFEYHYTHKNLWQRLWYD
jgi:TonB family protein